MAGIAGVPGSVAEAVYPPVCPLTGADTARHGTLAAEAWRGLALLSGPACRACGRELPGAPEGEALLCDGCTARPRPWTRGVAAFRYDGTGRELVLALKRGDRLDLAQIGRASCRERVSFTV